METKPIPTRKATNDQLAEGINQLHICHEDTKRQIVEIKHALGITEGRKPVAGLSSPWKAFIRSAGATATAMGGLILLYRFAIAIGPGVWTFLQNLNHVILTGKF